MKNNSSHHDKNNRRKFQRINKQFILTYFHIQDPENQYEITQLKNISEGGMCFVASRPSELNTQIGIKLKTPYLSDTTYFEGTVLGSHEKISNLVYEIRTEFSPLNESAKFLINKLKDVFLKGQENEGDCHA